MEPNIGVSEQKLTRRDFLKSAAFISSIPILSRVSKAPEDCSPKVPPIPEVSGKSKRMGVTITRDMSVPPFEIRSLGASWVRFVGMQEKIVDPERMRSYIDDLHKAGIKALMVIAKESIEDLSWEDAAKKYRDFYGSKVDAFQLGNEPDDEASWVLDPKSFGKLLWEFRNAMPEAFLVAGGLDQNRPEYLAQVDIDWADVIALHPYGQGLPGWPSPYGFPDSIDYMIERHLPYTKSKPIWITEWGIYNKHFGEEFAAEYVARMLGHLTQHQIVEKVFYYNMVDKADDSFSLIRIDNSKRPSYYAYQNIAMEKPIISKPQNLIIPTDLKTLHVIRSAGKFLNPHP